MGASGVKAWLNKGRDNHLRVAVTGLSRSGKTAFITALVNQLLNANSGAHLPLFSVVREGRLHGAKRVAQLDLDVPRFGYDAAMTNLYKTPPEWPVPTSSISEIRLALRYRSDQSFWRHFTQRSDLYVEIVDYPGEWLLDLPLLEMDYLGWSRSMHELLQGERQAWAKEWVTLSQQCDPFAPANEQQLAEIAQAYTDYLHQCKAAGLHFIQPGRFVLPGELAGAPVLQFFPWWMGAQQNEGQGEQQQEQLMALNKADKASNFGMLKARFEHYRQKIVKDFYKDYFQRFDRQVILVDCLQPLNSGPASFNDMRMAINQLMQSFHYGQRTLLRRWFAPHIDKLMFAATKADHVTPEQHANLTSLLQHLVKDAWQHVAFEGIQIDCAAMASIRATEYGVIEKNGERIPTLKGHRLEDGKPLVVYPGTVPATLPEASFWEKPSSQPFNFDQFRPLHSSANKPLPHIRLDAVMEFLLGDKLK